MGGGAPKTQVVKQTSTTSNIPEYARPYFEELLQRGRTESTKPYQAYEGERIAGFDPTEQEAFGQYENIARTQPGGLAEAQNVAQEVAGYAPGFYQGQQFSGDAVGRFMDPYVQNVLNVQQARAQRRYDEGKLRRSQQSVQRGAFGGSRQAVAESLARRDLDEQLAMNEAKGLSEAFRFGAGQFEKEQARMQEGAKAAAQSKLAAGQLGGNLSKQEQELALQRAKALEQVGKQRRDMDQRRMQMGYQDFLNQRDWNRQQLDLYSSLLRGTNITPTQDVQYSQPSPNPFAQGAGTAAGLYGLIQQLQAGA